MNVNGLAQRASQKFRQSGDQFGHVRRGRPQRLAARESQQVLCEFGAPVGGADSAIEKSPGFGGGVDVIFQEFEIAQNDRQEVVEVVGDAPRKLADGFHLLSLAELGFGRLVFREVAQGADEPAPALLRRQFVDHQIDRKAASILALAFDLAAEANDPRFSGLEVSLQVVAVLSRIVRRHQNVDIAA